METISNEALTAARAKLDAAESRRENILLFHIANGVNIESRTVQIDEGVVIAPGATILAGTILRGKTVIGAGCVIGPNSLIEDSTANFPERLPDFVYDFTDGDSSHDYDNADTYIDLSILVGEQIELPLSDGATLALSFEPGEDGSYTLGYIAPDGSKQYVEQGYSSCSEESDSWYDEERFPTEDYEFYLTWMTKNEEAASNTTVPPWYDARGESDIWLCIYRSRTDGSIILQDMDQLGLFGDTDIYELNPTALI